MLNYNYTAVCFEIFTLSEQFYYQFIIRFETIHCKKKINYENIKIVMSEMCMHKNEIFKLHKAQKSFSRQWGFISLDDIQYAILHW